MTKRFETLIDVYDHVLPTWSSWDLLVTAPPEQCQHLKIDGAFRYRLSDGAHAINVWVILDSTGVYRRAPMELEVELNNFHLKFPVVKRPAVVPAPPRTPERSIFANPLPLSPPTQPRTQPRKMHQQRSLVDV